MPFLAELLSIDELYLAGQCVAAGLYRDTETGREINLEQQDTLPASLDGRVAVYTCVEYTWGKMSPQPLQEARAFHARRDGVTAS